MSARWRWAAAAILLLVACAPHPLSREGWQGMRGSEKELYVRTLLGHEQVLLRKGGQGDRYTSAPTVYVRRIDARFAAGEKRPVEAIWPELADGRGAGRSAEAQTATETVPVVGR